MEHKRREFWQREKDLAFRKLSVGHGNNRAFNVSALGFTKPKLMVRMAQRMTTSIQMHFLSFYWKGPISWLSKCSNVGFSL